MPVVQLPVDEYLSFSNVSSKIRDRVSDVYEAKLEGFRYPVKAKSLTIVWHCKDGNLSDGAVAAFYSTCTLVDGGQIGIHVSCLKRQSTQVMAYEETNLDIHDDPELLPEPQTPTSCI